MLFKKDFWSLFRFLLCHVLFIYTLSSKQIECEELHQPTQSHYRYQMAICAIFQNDAPYLKEWIEFHKLVGVQHFYLYNHLSTDHYLEVLKPYIKKNEVDLIDWPYPVNTDASNWTSIQCQAYNHALQLAKGHAKWVAFLDTDEFLFPSEKNNLVQFLRSYEDVAGVCVNWQLYGTSQVKRIPSNKLMIEMLTIKAPTHHAENIHVKSIVRPEFVSHFENPHFCSYQPGYFQVNTNKEPFWGAFAPYIAIDKLRINHYWSRDEKYFFKFKLPRRTQWQESVDSTLQRLNSLNQEADEVILRFVPKLRKSMKMAH